MAVRYRSRRQKIARSFRVQPKDLGLVVDDILTVYTHNVTEEIKEKTDQVAEDATREVRNRSPKRTGTYAESWKWTNLYDSALERRDAIYNDGHWQLIHLLEWGHIIRNQYSGNHYSTVLKDYVKGTAFGHTRKFPHVMPTVEYAITIYTQLVKEAIKDAAD